MRRVSGIVLLLLYFNIKVFLCYFQDRLNDIRRMVIKEIGVLSISESQSQNPIDRPSGSGIVSEKGSIN